MTNEHSASGVSIKVDEPASVPPLDILLAYAAMVPLVAGAIAAPFLTEPDASAARDLALTWGAAILLFFAGVRRGTSFRTMNGPTLSQIATMLGLFGAGLISVLALSYRLPLPAGVVELVAYVGLAVMDPIAARRGELPLYFRRLRPLQMSLAALAVLGLTLGAASR